MFQNPAAAAAAAAPASVRARRPRPKANEPQEADDDKKNRPVSRREAGERKMHSILDRLDDFFNKFGQGKAKPEARVVPTAPIIQYDPIYLKYKVFLTNADVVMSLAALTFVTLLLLVAPSDARVSDLIGWSTRRFSERAGRARQAALPRIVSADIVLLVLTSMAVNSFALAMTRVVEREHKAEMEKRMLEEINEANDIDPAKMAAYEAKDTAARKAREEKRAALMEENQKRREAGKPHKRHRVTITGIVEVDSVTDAIIPIVVFWPLVLGTIVVLQPPNAVRGFGVIILFAQMIVAAVLAKLTGSTATASHTFNVSQSISQMILMLLVAMQWWNE